MRSLCTKRVPGFHILAAADRFTAEEGVTQVSLIASARDANHQELVTKSAIWNPRRRLDLTGSPRLFPTFGLGGFGLTLEQQRQATFHLKVNISFDALRAPLAYEEDIQAFNGALPYTAPSDRVEVVTLTVPVCSGT